MSKVTQWIKDNSIYLVKCDCGHWSEVVGCSPDIDDTIPCPCCWENSLARRAGERGTIQEIQTALEIMLKRITALLPRKG